MSIKITRHDDSLSALRTTALTTGALVAFAGNSLLCRLALGEAAIDPASYTALRLAAGALTLWLICRLRGNERAHVASGKSALGGTLLFLYAIAFAYAYQSLSAGSGALILFAAVQLTMIVAALATGERPSPVEWRGWLLALAGFVYLVFPGIAAPPLGGSMLMMVAGIAWGVYSLLGRGAANPINATRDSFLCAMPLVLLCVLIQLPGLTVSPTGIAWALLSGAVPSGLGYVLWYAALGRLTATRAAIVQLAVPVIAAFAGVWLLSEPVSARLSIAGVGIIGGIALALSGRQITLAKHAPRFCCLRLAPGCARGRR